MSSAPRALVDADGAYDVLAPAYDLLTAGYAYAPRLEALLDLGFEVLGSDASPGMRVDDMRELPVYGCFDLVTCLDDALNHPPTAAGVERALRAMAANLAPDGLPAFDLNTLTAYRDLSTIPATVAVAGHEVLAIRGQRSGGRLEPDADES